VAVHRITRGLDVPLAGAPVQAVEPARAATRVALVAADYVGLKPTMLVQPGDRVRRGQPVFEDKKTPGVRYTAPAAGTVAAIHRGDKRAFQSLVITVGDDEGPDAQVALSSFTGRPVAELDAGSIRALLVESGLWTAFRTRPFSRIPAADSTPESIFVTAVDTHPHAPDVAIVLADRGPDFEIGVTALQALTSGKVYVCKAAGSPVRAPAGPKVAVEEFTGPHPAGTPGVHIHLLDPVDHGRTVWHVGYQDVAAIGRLLATGRIDVERVVSLAGPGVARPRLLRTRLGASIDELAGGELVPGEQRVLSGSVLDGRIASGEVHGYLGRHHLQVSALPEGRRREMFGWITPGRDKFSLWGVVAGHFAKGTGLPLTTTTNGGKRAMVPIGGYERVMPMDLMPTFLLRALIIGDIERAEALGCLELDEEDLALCTFVCPGKIEYGPLLRAMLDRIEKEAG
jgi:Na+-transporting NADH:ubiquinone oxidoreductase subunit A